MYIDTDIDYEIDTCIFIYLFMCIHFYLYIYDGVTLKYKILIKLNVL